MEEDGVLVRKRKLQWCPEQDAELIAAVRTRSVLYDCLHDRYTDNRLKAAIWLKISKQLNSTPGLCKARWNNIRDNYRKGLQRPHAKTQYKYARSLAFLDRFLSLKPAAKKQRSAESETSNEAEEAAPEPPDTQAEIDTSYVKIDGNEVQSEPIVDYDMFEESSTSVTPKDGVRAQAVAAFLGALAPPLRELSPYLLSLAKAEIFAVVHKYELKGLRERGWGNSDDPLP